MSLPAPVLYDAVKHQYLLQQIAQIHADCVLNDGTVVTFHPDETGQMDIPAIVKYWEARSTQVTAGTREIIMQFADDSEEELIGYVSLDTPVTQTGAFRGAVEKLLVSPKHRYKGIARRLMAKLEDVAWAKGRVLLKLDTIVGSGADLMYPKLDYKCLGVIAQYGIHPLTKELVDEIFFYKDLRDHR